MAAARSRSTTNSRRWAEQLTFTLDTDGYLIFEEVVVVDGYPDDGVPPGTVELSQTHRVPVLVDGLGSVGRNLYPLGVIDPTRTPTPKDWSPRGSQSDLSVSLGSIRGCPVPTNGKVGTPFRTCKSGCFPFFATLDSIFATSTILPAQGPDPVSRSRKNEQPTSGTSKGRRVSPRHGVGLGQHPKRYAGWETCGSKGGHSRDINNALRWRHWPCFRL